MSAASGSVESYAVLPEGHRDIKNEKNYVTIPFSALKQQAQMKTVVNSREIAFEDLVFDKMLGEGNYGRVFKGYLPHRASGL